jgi:hypothetical protein
VDDATGKIATGQQVQVEATKRLMVKANAGELARP